MIVGTCGGGKSGRLPVCEAREVNFRSYLSQEVNTCFVQSQDKSFQAGHL